MQKNSIFIRSGMEDFTEAERSFMGGGLIFGVICAKYLIKINNGVIMQKNAEKTGDEVVINGEALRGKIYTIRGRRVMLDYDLAAIYGYETKAFNRQVKNNMEKFEGEDFMFQLTWDEVDLILRCKNCTLEMEAVDGMGFLRRQNGTTMEGNTNEGDFVRCQNGILQNKKDDHFRYLPYAFTEQGIYMLMTVLRGELAVKQSRALIRMFKSMKDYIVENQERIEYKNSMQLAMRVMENTRNVDKMRTEICKLDGEINEVNKKLNDRVIRSEISPILLDFGKVMEQREYIFLNGQPFRASEAYMDIYIKAKRSIYIIDNYASVKTLHHLRKIRAGVDVAIFTDNKGKCLRRVDFEDYRREFPERKIRFMKTNGVVHDRFIIIDCGMDSEAMYHCGASEKDAGGKMTVISRLDDVSVRATIREGVAEMMKSGALWLE